MRNQKGFTLIEIIAVLVILGILAAVAIPRYIDLQQEAKNRAALGAVAAAQSALSMQYARLLLVNATAPDATAVVAAVDANCNVGTGDFTVTCAESGAAVTITVAGNAGTNVEGASATGTFTLP